MTCTKCKFFPTAPNSLRCSSRAASMINCSFSPNHSERVRPPASFPLNGCLSATTSLWHKDSCASFFLSNPLPSHSSHAWSNIHGDSPSYIRLLLAVVFFFFFCLCNPSLYKWTGVRRGHYIWNSALWRATQVLFVCHAASRHRSRSNIGKLMRLDIRALSLSFRMCCFFFLSLLFLETSLEAKAGAFRLSAGRDAADNEKDWPTYRKIVVRRTAANKAVCQLCWTIFACISMCFLKKFVIGP